MMMARGASGAAFAAQRQMRARAKPRHTADILTAFNRPHRHPIPMLLAQLTARLDQMDTPASAPFEMASILNRAALMEVQFGRPGLARSLCDAQIDWVARHVIPSHGAENIYLGFQPWINLARLDRMTGQGAKWSERLEDILKAFERRSVRLDALNVRPPHYNLIDAIDPYFPSFLRNSYLTERLVAALGDPAPHAIDAAIEGLDIKGSARSLSVVAEARMLHAMRHGGDVASAERWAATPADRNPRRQLALRLRALALRGDCRDGRGTAARDEMEGIARDLMGQDMDPLSLAIFANAVGFLADHDPRTAGPFIAWGKSRAAALGDCVSAHWFETVLCDAPPSPHDTQDFVDRTWMYGLHKQTPPRHRVAVIDEFTHRLMSFVA